MEKSVNSNQSTRLKTEIETLESKANMTHAAYSLGVRGSKSYVINGLTNLVKKMWLTCRNLKRYVRKKLLLNYFIRCALG